MGNAGFRIVARSHRAVWIGTIIISLTALGAATTTGVAWSIALSRTWDSFGRELLAKANVQPRYTVVWLIPFLGFRAARRILRARRGLCTRCAYDLKGLPPGSPCPECGQASAPSPSV